MCSSRYKNHNIFFKSFGINKINKLVIIIKKLTNNFAGQITNGLEPDAARGPHIMPLWFRALFINIFNVATH
jgi:hypothetical protein